MFEHDQTRTPGMPAGEFVLQCIECKYLTGFYGETCIAEFLVLESKDKEYEGAKVAKTYTTLENKDMAGPKIAELKKLVAAAMGYDPNNEVLVQKYVSLDTLKSVVGEDQPLAGKTVRCIAKDAMSKGGHSFVQCTWSLAE